VLLHSCHMGGARLARGPSIGQRGGRRPTANP
jgi:hypothetical protein